MKITFLGAAGEVTGSQHLLETSNLRLLLDCGFFQGPRSESRRKNEVLSCDPKNLDGVILSHGHLDHCGNLPRLFRMGYRGPIFCTEATADIAELMLLDSAKIQEEDAIYLSRKLRGDHPPVEPLYTMDDVQSLMKNFEPYGFNEWLTFGERNELRLRFLPAGHILGSAIVEIEIDDNGETKRIVFSGDLGRRNTPLLVDPTVVTDGADAVICEATYGNRMHGSEADMRAVLLRSLWQAHETGGRVIIPAFALGRTQQVTHLLNDMYNAGELPPMPIYVDSPLATKMTQLFRRYQKELDADVQQVLTYDDQPFDFSYLTYVQNQRDSVALNRQTCGFAVISASGMCESGRVVHHLKHAVSDSRNIILLMGYQASNTLGRQLAERRKTVRIFNREYPLEAQVHQLDGLSAHADAGDLKWWFEEANRHASFQKAFLVHAEPQAAEALASLIRDNVDEDPIIPQYGESYEI